MVDLSLASSYVPAFVCLVKCLLITSLSYVLVPIGGLCVLGLLLLLDRVFWGSDFILDVNAVVLSVLWSQVANHERHHFGFRTPVFMLLSVVWCCAAVALSVYQTGVHLRSELYGYMTLAACLSITYMALEPFSYCVARTLVFNVAVLLQVYWHIASGREEPLVLTLFRYGFVLLAMPLAAFLGALGCCVVVALRWRPHTGASVQAEPDVETAAAVLREALASRKEKSGN
jgi:hypothetical protein